MTKRVVIYCRVSDPKQEKGASLETQEEKGREYADGKKWDVVAALRETHTGKEFWERPKLGEVREMVRRGEVDVVLVYAVDRLSRKQAHVAIIADECERYGVLLDFVTEDFEQSAVGEFIRSAKAFAAEIEREKIIERTQRGIRARVEGTKHGTPKRMSGPRPLYGYDWADASKGRLVPNLLTAPIVQRIFREYADGASMRTLAASLTADGIPTPTGKPNWYQAGVRLILNHPAYTGQASAFRYRIERVVGTKANGTTGTIVRVFERDEEEQVALPEGTVPPLIDAETFAAVQQRLARNKVEATRRSSDPESTLLRAGFVVCGYCGHPMRVGPTKTGPVYRCAGTTRDRYGCPYYSIKAEIVDSFVWSKVARVLKEPKQIAAEWRRMLDAGDPTEQDHASTERRVSKLASLTAKLSKRLAVEEDDDIAAMQRAELKDLLRQKREAEAERDRLAQSRAEWKAFRGTFEHFMSSVEAASANVDDFTYQQKRDALAWLGIRATIRRVGDGTRIDVKGKVDLETFGTARYVGRWDRDAARSYDPDRGTMPTFDRGRRWTVNRSATTSSAPSTAGNLTRSRPTDPRRSRG